MRKQDGGDPRNKNYKIKKEIINEIINEGLHEYLDDFQRKLNDVSTAIFNSFFSAEDISSQNQIKF